MSEQKRAGHELLVCQRSTAVVAGLLLLVSSVAMAKVGIDHDPIKKSKSGKRIAVEAKIKDKKAGIGEVRAYFKSGYDTRFWFAPMRPAGGERWVGILPAPALGADTVEYRIYAVNGVDDFVKTELYTVKIKDDEDALARMQQKEPTDIEIDLDRIEQARDLARSATEPDPSRRVEVRNDVPGSNNPAQLTGFQDYVVMAEATPAAAGAGLAAATTVSAGGGGLLGGVAGKALLGTAVLGGVAVAAGSSSSDDDDSGGSATRVVPCNNLTTQGGDTAETVAVELGRSTGHFRFRYETFSQEDRITISQDGRQLFTTGCVGESRNVRVNFSGSSSRVLVRVEPNCMGGSGTQWEFTVNCPSDD